MSLLQEASVALFLFKSQLQRGRKPVKGERGGKKSWPASIFFFSLLLFSNRTEKLQPETELLFKCSRPCYALNPQVHLI